MLQRLCLIFLTLSLCLLGCSRVQTPKTVATPVSPAPAAEATKTPAPKVTAAPVLVKTNAETPIAPVKNNDKTLANKPIKVVEAPKPQPIVTVAPARIIFYRETKFVGSALNYDIYEQNTKRASLKNGSYFLLEVPPGRHSFYMREVNPSLPALGNNTGAPQVLTIDVKAGETRYIKGGVETGIMGGHPILTQASETEAKLNLGKLLDAR